MLRLIVLETRLLWREAVAVAVLLIVITASVLAIANGRALLGANQAGRTAAIVEADKAQAEFRAKLAKPMPPADAVYLPMQVRLGVAAPMPPLIDASAGRAAYDAVATGVSLRARADTLFKRTSLANPEMLARGGFDLGFVAIVIAPLLLIGLGHGVFTADRDSGTARLVLAQAGGPGRLLLARSIPRLGLVIVPLIVALIWLIVTGPALPSRGSAALGWAAVVLLYLAFWWSIILLVNTLRISAETAALALASAWALVTLVLPAVISAVAQIAYPPPSRFEQIASARAAEIAATTAWDNDHKAQVEGDVAGALADARRSVAIGRTVEAAVAPVNARFDDQLAAQRRVVTALSLLSPPLVAGDALVASAGTGPDAALAFRQATAAYLATLKARLGGFIDGGEPMTAAGYDALPRFVAAPASRPPSLALLYLCVATLAAGILAARRYARLRLD
jgi:ABC-2 type transport system permease protein